jgi:hypothetical protein
VQVEHSPLLLDLAVRQLLVPLVLVAGSRLRQVQQVQRQAQVHLARQGQLHCWLALRV